MVQAIDEVRRRASGRVPPHNLEAEESLLGSMLLSRDAITAAVEARVDATDFYKPAHTHVFEAVMALYGQGEPVDPVTVAEELRRAELLDALGGTATLLRIQAGTPASANAGHYASIVNELALLRRLIAVAGDIAEMGYDAPDDITQTLDRAESLVFEVAERRVSESMTGISDALQSTLDQLESMYGRESDVTGVPTGYLELDELLLGLQPSNLVIVAARPGAGKCVAWDTPIVDPSTGAVRTAAEVFREGRQGNDVRVLALDDDRRIRCVAPSAYVDDGVKPVYRVQTRTGRVIRTTLSHPFLTPTGWRPLADISAGTRVAVPRRIPVFGREAVPEAELALVAFLLADRAAAHRPPATPDTPDPLLHDLKRHARALGVSVESNDRADCRLVARHGSSRPVASNRGVGLLRRYGLLQERASTRQLPPMVFRLPRAGMAFFLNHLFAANGSVWVERQSATVSYLSSSDRLARDVQHLLLRFGVLSRIRQKPRRPGEPRHQRWELLVSEPASVRRFATDIGILGRDAEMRSVLAATDAASARPAVADESLDARVALLARGRAARSGHPAGGATTARTAGAASVLERRELAVQPSADVCWDEVVAIAYDGDEQVYDLTVPELHNFVAGDVFVHNTSFALGAAANVALVSRRPTLFFSMEMGKLELTKRLLAGEARVEARKLWTGNIPEGDWTRLSHAVGRLAEAPLFIDDNAHCTVMEMRAKARRIKARYGDLGLIVVDYVQLMSSGVRHAENRQVEVSELSRGLKILARDLECPVMALSQLNRQLEYRQDKRPMLADLRESGCLTADTLVTRADTGADVTMGELLERGERDIPVWTLDEHYKLVRGVMTHVFPSGTKPVFEMRLASGRSVKGSGNHPFLTIDGWKRLDELEPGSRIAAARHLPSPERREAWPDDEVILLAHLVGDGCHLKTHALQYTTTDPANAATVAAVARRLFGIEARLKREGKSDEETWTQVYLPAPFHLTHGKRNPIAEWLEPLGLWDKRSWEKFVPAEVLSLDERQLALFLRHLWATDGSLQVVGGKTPRTVIKYSTTSPMLARDVQALLLRLGIRARVKVVPERKGRVRHDVSVTGWGQQIRFIELIGCHGARGEIVPEIRRFLLERHPNTNVDTVPKEIWEYIRHKVMPSLGVTARELAAGIGMQYCGSTLYRHGLGRERMGRVAQVLPDPLLRDLAESDVIWDEVTAITPLGDQPIFDATVNDTHNFLANGLVAHNSLEQDADVVSFIYRDEIYNPESDQRGTAEIIVSKHRNGPTGSTRLAFLADYTKFANMARD